MVLVLLALILISPFVSALKKIKIGDFEAEIDPKEVRQVKEQASLLAAEAAEDDQVLAASDAIQRIRDLSTTDHVLALAKLRIELEHAVQRIDLHERERRGDRRNRNRSLMEMVRELTANDVLSKPVEESLSRVISICNRAIHGQDIRQEDAATIIDIGCTMLEHLNVHLQRELLEPSQQEVIDDATVQRFRSARYRVTTIVPLVEDPVRNVRVLDQQGLDDLLDGYPAYAEFIVGVEEVGDGS